MASPRPLPTAIKVLRGNPGKRPLPKGEPQPARDLPEPPSHLGLIAKEEWERLAPELHRIGVLTMADRTVLAGYCVLYQRWKAAEEGIDELVSETPNGYMIQNACVGIANKALELMLKYMGELGLTPSSRTKLAGVQAGDEDALNAFLQKKRRRK